MCTAEALKKLALQEVHLVCLAQGGQLTALVTFDSKREELVFRLLRRERLSVSALLFQTQAAWVR